MDIPVEQVVGHPALQLTLLFLGPYLLEEAAILGATALAAAQELRPLSAFVAVYLGIVTSDWLLYGVGWGAGRSARLRAWVGEEAIGRGRRMLSRGAFPAGLTARLVPWLLFPIFVSSGFLGVGFQRFAAINAAIALVYTAILFLGLYLFNVALFDLFAGWGWLAVAVAGVLLLLAIRAGRRHYRDDSAGSSDGAG
jgi:membrane protein DedA with SNARE-associated domain